MRSANPVSGDQRHTPPWSTRQHFRVNAPYVPDAPERALRDVNFYKMSNHFLLHSHDSYLLHQNATTLVTFLTDQRDFWDYTIQVSHTLGMKFGAYKGEISEYWQPFSDFRRLADQIDDLRAELRETIDTATKYSKWFRQQTVTAPVHVANRLVEEVKLPPPCIPPISRRFSFG